MSKTIFDNIYTDIEPISEQYRVLLRIYGNEYYLEPVDTIEQAEDINTNLNLGLMHIHQEVFYKRLKESNIRFSITMLSTFGFIMMSVLVSSFNIVPESYKKYVVLILLICGILVPLINMLTIRKPSFKDLMINQKP